MCDVLALVPSVVIDRIIHRAAATTVELPPFVEAASDGAGRWKVCVYDALAMLRPIILDAITTFLCGDHAATTL